MDLAVKQSCNLLSIEVSSHYLQRRTYIQSVRTAAGVMKIVKAVVQVVGTYNIPAVPRDAREVRDWYYSVSAYPSVPK